MRANEVNLPKNINQEPSATVVRLIVIGEEVNAVVPPLYEEKSSFIPLYSAIQVSRDTPVVGRVTTILYVPDTLFEPGKYFQSMYVCDDPLFCVITAVIAFPSKVTAVGVFAVLVHVTTKTTGLRSCVKEYDKVAVVPGYETREVVRGPINCTQG